MSAANRYYHSLMEAKFAGATGLARYTLDAIIQMCTDLETQSPADFTRELDTICELMLTAKPSRAPLDNALRYVRSYAVKCMKNSSGTGIQAETKLAAQRYKDYVDRAQKLTSQQIVRQLDGVKSVMTLCRSTTVMRGIEELYRRNNDLRVIVLEARPDYDGWEAAKELGGHGISVTLVVDAAALSFLDKTDVILVGADVVVSDGSVVNRVGTCQLATIARLTGHPFYVATATYTFQRLDPAQVVLAHRSPYRVVPQSVLSKWSNVSVENQVDDLTPAGIITKIICDVGSITPTQVAATISDLGEWFSGGDRITMNQNT